jgi:hypothetical protein
MDKFHGFYRAKVVDNKDPQKFGRVLIWIPDVMPLVNQTEGIWARPANNPIGGRNMENDTENYYAGTSYIPRKGSWLWIFFEAGNINRPYYFAALDLENTKVLPENQLGANYEDKWTIFKSPDGRTIVVSDDPSDKRIEITGRKQTLGGPPTGNTSSVYTIDNNQTTILLDERDGKEKVLIRTHKGDFFHIDIDSQKLQAYFKSDIIIKTDGNLQITANQNIDIRSQAGNIKVLANGGQTHIKSASDINITTGGVLNEVSQDTHKVQSGGNISHLSGGTISHDGSLIQDNCGASTGATQAGDAATADPKGERNT